MTVISLHIILCGPLGGNVPPEGFLVVLLATKIDKKMIINALAYRECNDNIMFRIIPSLLKTFHFRNPKRIFVAIEMYIKIEVLTSMFTEQEEHSKHDIHIHTSEFPI